MNLKLICEKLLWKIETLKSFLQDFFLVKIRRHIHKLRFDVRKEI